MESVTADRKSFPATRDESDVSKLVSGAQTRRFTSSFLVLLIEKMYATHLTVQESCYSRAVCRGGWLGSWTA